MEREWHPVRGERRTMDYEPIDISARCNTGAERLTPATAGSGIGIRAKPLG